VVKTIKAPNSTIMDIAAVSFKSYLAFYFKKNLK